MDTGNGEYARVAEEELCASLQQLNEAMSALPDGTESKLQELKVKYRNLGDSMKTEDFPAFQRALVGLAQLVIKIRESDPGGPLGDLPVPRYLPWVPFKAKSHRNTATSKDESQSVGPYKNRKVKEFIEKGHFLLESKLGEAPAADRKQNGNKE